MDFFMSSAFWFRRPVGGLVNNELLKFDQNDKSISF